MNLMYLAEPIKVAATEVVPTEVVPVTVAATEAVPTEVVTTEVVSHYMYKVRSLVNHRGELINGLHAFKSTTALNAGAVLETLRLDWNRFSGEPEWVAEWEQKPSRLTCGNTYHALMYRTDSPVHHIRGRSYVLAKIDILSAPTA